MELSQGKLIELIVQTIPYPSHITDWDFSEEDAIRFQWRETSFRVSKNLFVEERDRCFLKGSDITIIFETLLKKVYLEKQTSKG